MVSYFSRLVHAFSVQTTVALDLVGVMMEAHNSRQMLEALEAHFGITSHSNQITSKRSVFMKVRDLKRFGNICTQIVILANQKLHRPM